MRAIRDTARFGVIAFIAVATVIDLVGLVLYVAGGREHPRLNDSVRSDEDILADLAQAGIDPLWYVAFRVTLELVILVPSVVAAVLILWRRRTSLFHMYLALTLVALAAGAGGGLHAFGTTVLGDTGPLMSFGLVSIALFFVVFYLFPSGRFVPYWTRWAALGWVAFGVVSLITQWWTRGPVAVGIATAVVIALLASAGAAQIYRYVKVSSVVERQQTKWVLLALSARVVYLVIIVSLPLGAVDSIPGPGGLLVSSLVLTVSYLLSALLAVTIAIAILKYRLFDVDIVISRVLVYGVLTAFVLVGYVGIVGGIGALLRDATNPLLPFLATAVLAIAFHPVHQWAQRLVSRVVFGRRREPYTVLARLARELGTAEPSESTLATLVDSLASELKFERVRLITTGDVAIAESGLDTASVDASTRLVEIPVTYGAVTLGSLQITQRPGEVIRAADLRLLQDIASQAALALQAARTSRQLQRSREQLVVAREDERLRLHRDLHDGLGPTLASLHQRVDVASRLLDDDPDASRALLEGTKSELLNTIADIRRLVYELRPPILDQQGLVGALTVALRPVGIHDELPVQISVPEPVGALPAEAEVAAYRIALEVVSNSRRHAHATRIDVSVTVEIAGTVRWLIVQVTDDGVGLKNRHDRGVGLASVTRRAEEIGGTFTIARIGDETRASARLPLRGIDQ